MPVNLDIVSGVNAPTLETPEVVTPEVEANKKVKAPLVQIDKEVFRRDSNLLSFQGYIGNNFRLESKVDGKTGEKVEKTVIDKRTKEQKVITRAKDKVVKRPQSVGFAVKNEGVEDLVYWKDRYIDATGKKTLITEERFDEIETEVLPIGETAYLTKFAFGLLLGDERFGSRLGAGILLPALEEKAKEAGVEFDPETQLSVTVRGGSEDSLRSANIYLGVLSDNKVGESVARVSVPVTRYPLHIATEVGSVEDGYPASPNAVIKPEFEFAFGALAEKSRGTRKKSNSADVNDSARRLIHLARMHNPKNKG